MMVTVSLDSPSCEVTLFDPVSVVYQDATRQAKGLHRLKHVGVLKRGLAYLSRVAPSGQSARPGGQSARSLNQPKSKSS
jgi:hypothetical protein